MGLDDKKDWKIDKPIGIQSEQERQAINQARRRDQFIGKVMREARSNKDLKGYLEAEKAGYTDRGIENVDDKNARFRESANQRRFYGDGAVGPGQPPTGGSQPPTGSSQPPNVGTPPTTGTPPVPAPTAGFPVGSGSEIGTAQPATPAMSAAEQSKQATLEKTLAGNFGKVAQARAQAKQSGGTYDATPSFDTRTEGRKAFVDTVGTLNVKEGGITPKEVEQAKARGAVLGLTPQQIQDTLDGETELSPEAIAGRAKSKKDAAAKKAYDKEFKSSDDYIEKAIAGLGSKFTDANKVADSISKPLDAVSFQRIEAALDSSRRREGNRAMNFADIIGGYLTGKKNKIVKTIKEPRQASIDTNNASKEFRSGYDTLKVLESFTI